MTFTDLQNEIAGRLNINSTEGLARIGTAVNRHYKRITSALGIVTSRRAPVTITATIASRYITCSNVEKVYSVRDTSSGSTKVLEEVLVEELLDSDTNTSDQPSKYAIYTMGADSVVLITDVTAQTEYTLQADAMQVVGTLSGSNEPAFPESFHDVLIESVMADELRKKGKIEEAVMAMEAARKILSDLRMHIAKSGYLKLRQGPEPSSHVGVGGAGGGGGSVPAGGTSYTQTGLITFDREPNAPFAVTDTSAYVPNLYSEGVGNVTSDRLIGRDTAGAGESEQLTVGGGVEFTGSGGIQRSALTGDVTASAGSNATTIANDAVTTVKILNDAVTYAKIQNVSAAARVLGRGGAAGSGNAEELTVGSNLSLSATELNLASSVNMADGVLTRPEIKDYAETRTTPASSSGTLALDLENGNTFEVTTTENITTITISNPPATGKCGSFMLKVNYGGAHSLSWPASVRWAGASAPVQTSTNGKTDIFSFVTTDGGTKWFGVTGGLNYTT